MDTKLHESIFLAGDGQIICLDYIFSVGEIVYFSWYSKQPDFAFPVQPFKGDTIWVGKNHLHCDSHKKMVESQELLKPMVIQWREELIQAWTKRRNYLDTIKTNFI